MLSCLIPFTILLIVLLVTVRPDKSSPRFVPYYVVISGLFFSLWTAFLIFDSSLSTPLKDAVGSAGCCGPELLILVFTPILDVIVLGIGSLFAYALTRGLWLETTASLLTVAISTGFVFGTLAGIIFHFPFWW